MQDFLRESVDNITLTFSTDGVPVFSSSKGAVWPLICTINELPLAERSWNIVLHTLWFGATKPKMDTFLKPFVEELSSLYIQGFKWTDCNGVLQTMRCAAICCICDSVAQPLLHNTKQFNGEFGCSFCTHPGSSVSVRRGHARVYTLEVGSLPDLRTNDECLQLASLATDTGQVQNGIKGPTILSRLPLFDIVQGFTPEYMHSMLLGVVRQFSSIWLESPSQLPYSLSKNTDMLDSQLLRMKPPMEIRRLPRSLDTREF